MAVSIPPEEQLLALHTVLHWYFTVTARTGSSRVVHSSGKGTTKLAWSHLFVFSSTLTAAVESTEYGHIQIHQQHRRIDDNKWWPSSHQSKWQQAQRWKEGGSIFIRKFSSSEIPERRRWKIIKTPRSLKLEMAAGMGHEWLNRSEMSSLSS